jgi:Kef-type K+ transport system membrane component KefB
VTLPIAAAADAADALGTLFIVLLAAKLGDELFRRLGQPAIVGEILAGVVIGPSLLGVVEPSTELDLFAELGVVLLLFWVGVETRLSELTAVGRAAFLVGVLGVVLPLAGGFGLAEALGESFSTAVFLGAALTATSVGITSAVLVELRALRRPGGRTILGAAVIDDILALLILALAVGLVAEDDFDPTGVVLTTLLSLAFVAFFALGGTRVARRWPQLLEAPRFAESPLLPAVLLCLGLAAFAAKIGLAAIVGAFLAGLILAETRERAPVEGEIAPLYAVFTPFFFASIGVSVDLNALLDWKALALVLAVTAVAIATKFIGAWLGARSLGPRDATLVGVGMVPRGEVGIVVASIGLSEQVIDKELFGVIVAMSVLTTLLVPPLLRALLARERGDIDHPQTVATGR